MPAGDGSHALDVLNDDLAALIELLGLLRRVGNLLVDASAEVDFSQRDVQLTRAEVMKVATDELVLLAHAEHTLSVRDEEEDGAKAAGPDGDAQAADDLVAEQFAGVGMAVNDADILRKEGDGKAAPDAAKAVHLGSLEWVVDLQLLHEHAAEAVDKRADDSDAEGGPGLDDVAAGRDADEAGKNAVRNALEVEQHALLGWADVGLDEEGDDAGGTWRDDGVDDDELGSLAAVADDAAGRAAVEQQPSEPENERA